jgi:hypothetical protein
MSDSKPTIIAILSIESQDDLDNLLDELTTLQFVEIFIDMMGLIKSLLSQLARGLNCSTSEILQELALQVARRENDKDND